MELRLPLHLVDKVIEKTEDKVLITAKRETQLRRIVVVDGLKIAKSTLKELHLGSSGTNADYAQSIAFLYSALRGKKDLKVHNMGELRTALISYLNKDFIKGFLFKRGESSSVLPFLVTSITDNMSENASKYRRNYYREQSKYVTIVYSYSDIKAGERVHTKTIGPSAILRLAEDLEIEIEPVKTKGTKEEEPYTIDFRCEAGISVEDILQADEFFRETAELHELYQKQTDRFLKFLPMYGKQFRVRGSSISQSSWYNDGELMLVDGKPGRCIMDTLPKFCVTENTEEEDRQKSRYRPYGRRHNDENEEENFSTLENLIVPLEDVTVADCEKMCELDWKPGTSIGAPLHPTLKVFHLDKQSYYDVHVRDLMPYKYKEGISEYLVLPQEVKDLTEMLVGMTVEGDDEDVIEGKSQAIIIAAMGDPGVGKTLMAEVMSEACEKPLYKIPAAQLGGNAEELEQELTKILRRAERWDCVLMIDEANAYLHSRDNNIQQNAIVGVFLRLLEYFKGILIVSTNLTNTSGTSFDLDSAFLDRCSAVIRLKRPEKEEAKKIWAIQVKLLKIEGVDDKMIDKLTDRFAGISGRSIRQLLKLTARTAKYKDEKLSIKHFETCSAFIAIPQSEVNVLESQKSKT